MFDKSIARYIFDLSLMKMNDGMQLKMDIMRSATVRLTRK